jgi:adenosine deaminase
MELSTAQAIALPKILLHDHLDGGLRPSTIIELAGDIGHALPSTDVAELVGYFRRGADAKDLLQYLDTFNHTIPLLQTAESLHRVAREAADDLGADGVIHAEVRFAPELHPGLGSLDAAIEAVTSGFSDSTADITVNTIVCAMRTEARSAEVAEAATRWCARKQDGRSGVVAFDLAGAETGFPPSDHAEALAIARRGLANITIHASEPPGLELIAGALEFGAQRIGHGVRLIEGCERLDDGSLELGPLARSIRNRRIPLELCPSCNVQIGAVPTLADHPLGPFLRSGILATVNTDNRLMSGVTLSSEVAATATAFDLTYDEIEQLQHNAAEAAFVAPAERAALDRRIREGFLIARATASATEL